jgi:hypothetical protein
MTYRVPLCPVFPLNFKVYSQHCPTIFSASYSRASLQLLIAVSGASFSAPTLSRGKTTPLPSIRELP